ncbi:hypothetical protein A966_07514 [Brachyspira hampsonii 30446]|uniref:Uncharacterized protein n=1 Tax=Brachyspira hampsonii 30446 TaxID=1289135 RepID=A0A2U4EVI6_9SPIR|nr:hypothetical protein A966_07514 [Brachyspira hampsonii 30446]OEJ18159.1 hypothetical protein A9495_00435 [Brachyspira hampsonii]PTY39865.1 hypothetical protein DQ06_04450 [Brachyspira hampsonii bv. II]
MTIVKQNTSGIKIYLFNFMITPNIFLKNKNILLYYTTEYKSQYFIKKFKIKKQDNITIFILLKNIDSV